MGLDTAEIAARLKAAGHVGRWHVVNDDLCAMPEVGLARHNGVVHWYLLADRNVSGVEKMPTVSGSDVEESRIGVVHAAMPAGAEVTLCCGRAPEDLPAGDSFAGKLEDMTCVPLLGTDVGHRGEELVGLDRRTVEDMPEAVDFRPDAGGVAPRTGQYRATEDGGQVLELPWTVVKSEGGPFDDDSFAAGVVCGLIQEQLKVGKAIGMVLSEPVMIRKDLFEQVDLIAMRFGYAMLTSAAWDDPRYDSGYVRFNSDVPHDHDDDHDDSDSD